MTKGELLHAIEGLPDDVEIRMEYYEEAKAVQLSEVTWDNVPTINTIDSVTISHDKKCVTLCSY
jgi:hypothetical protein